MVKGPPTSSQSPRQNFAVTHQPQRHWHRRAALRRHRRARFLDAVRALAWRVRRRMASAREVPTGPLDGLFPRYSWPEKLRFTKAANRSFELFYDDLLRSDLHSSCPELAVPVFMAAGRYDRMAPTDVAERYFNARPYRKGVGVVRGGGPLPTMGASRRVRSIPHREGRAKPDHLSVERAPTSAVAVLLDPTTTTTVALTMSRCPSRFGELGGGAGVALPCIATSNAISNGIAGTGWDSLVLDGTTSAETSDRTGLVGTRRH